MQFRTAIGLFLILFSLQAFAGFTVTGGGGSTFRKTFSNGDLSTGVLTINHGFGQYVQVQVYDNSEKLIAPDEITLTSTGVTTVTLTSFGTIAGNWNAIVLDSGAVYEGVTVASQAEAEAGTDDTKMMTPLKTAQAITAEIASRETIKINQSLVTSDFTGDTNVREYLRAYQDSSGNWRLQFNIARKSNGTLTGIATFSVSGVVSDSSSGFSQAVASMVADLGATAYAATNTYWAENSGSVVVSGTGNIDFASISGDILLASKPSWAL